MATGRERFWRGRIKTREHAEKIITHIATGFIVVCALWLVWVCWPPTEFYSLIVPAVFLIGGLAIRFNRSVAATRGLFWSVILAAAYLVHFTIFAVLPAMGYLYALLFVLVCGPFLLLPLCAAVRACTAAKFLRGPPPPFAPRTVHAIRSMALPVSQRIQQIREHLLDARRHPAPRSAGIPSAEASAPVRYRAFISYSHTDDEWSRWLHRALESYRVPKSLVDSRGMDGKVPAKLYPIFRDRDELPSSADLGEQITSALTRSSYLIVICSPAAARSHWVNEEIAVFMRMGRADRVLPVVVEGEPGSGTASDCLPPALQSPGHEVRVTADARPAADGKADTQIKLAARLLGVRYDALKHLEMEVHRQRAFVFRWVAAAMALFALFAAGGSVVAYQYMLRSEAVADAAVDVAGDFVGQGVKMFDRVGVSRTTVHSFLNATEKELTALYEKGVRTPQLQYQRAVHLVYFVDYYNETGDTQRAGERAVQAASLMQKIVDRYPENNVYVSEYLLAQDRVAGALVNQGKLDAALQIYRTMLTRAAADATQHRWLRNLSVTNNHLGDVYFAMGQRGAALVSYRAGRTIAYRLAQEKPANAEYQRDLATAEESVGHTMEAQGEFEPALQSFRTALQIRKRLIGGDPFSAVYLRDLSFSLGKLGGVLQALGRFGDAHDAFTAKLEIGDRLAGSDPGNATYQHDLSECHERLGGVLEAQNQLQAALESYYSSRGILQSLVNTDLGNTVWQGDLAIVNAHTADVKRKLGDLSGAWIDYHQASEVLRDLTRRFPQNAAWRDNLERVDNALRTMGPAQ